jgi:hypothetical protein
MGRGRRKLGCFTLVSLSMHVHKKACAQPERTQHAHTYHASARHFRCTGVFAQSALETHANNSRSSCSIPPPQPDAS